jgi:hypothetical protein
MKQAEAEGQTEILENLLGVAQGHLIIMQPLVQEIFCTSFKT